MHIAILGAGTMGHGIAQVSAMAGHEVPLTDIDESQLRSGIKRIEANLSDGVDLGEVDPATREGTLDRLTGTMDLAAAFNGADLVVEAVPEDVGLKRAVLADVNKAVPRDATIASNMSSIPITDLADVIDGPGRIVGLHFWNPVHIIDFVEVVRAAHTTDEIPADVREFVSELGKEDIVVERDLPGFASSRLNVALGIEAIRMVEDGVAGVEEVDTVMRRGYNHPMGSLEVSDMVGLDVRLDVAEYFHEEFGERFRPPQLLKRKVRAGELGQKTGSGFYRWEGEQRTEPLL